jgi:hypothetical protein
VVSGIQQQLKMSYSVKQLSKIRVILSKTTVRQTKIMPSSSISVTVRIQSKLIEAAKEKLPCAGSTEIITTALKYWLGIDLDQANLSAVSVNEDRFQFIEAQLAAIQEHIDGIDRSPKKAPKPKVDRTTKDYLTFTSFNERYQTSFGRQSGAKVIKRYLVDNNLPYEYDYASFKFYLVNQDG